MWGKRWWRDGESWWRAGGSGRGRCIKVVNNPDTLQLEWKKDGWDMESYLIPSNDNPGCHCCLYPCWAVNPLFDFPHDLFAVRHRKAIHGPEGQQPPMGQEESELSFDKDVDGSVTLTSSQSGLAPRSASGKKCTMEETKALYEMFSVLKRHQDVSVVVVF